MHREEDRVPATGLLSLNNQRHVLARGYFRKYELLKCLLLKKTESTF